MARNDVEGEVAGFVDDLVVVQLPSGAPFEVFKEEQAYCQRIVRQYKDETRVENISDFQDLDRVVILETLVYRYGTWLSRGRTYDGESPAESTYSRILKDQSAELRMLKASIGIDKKTRDAQQGDASVAGRWEDLQRRARQFEIVRCSQTQAALTLMHELLGIVTAHENMNDDERKELHLTAEEVIEWIHTNARRRFNEIDEEFIMNNQRMWAPLRPVQ